MSGAETETAERLSQIRARLENATPGPWSWNEEELNRKKYVLDGDGNPTHTKAGNLRMRKGYTWRDRLAYSLSGPMRGGVCEGPWNDVYDFHGVMHLHWWALKGKTTANATPGRGDRAFIANSRSDVEFLLAEVDRLSGIAQVAE